MNNTIKLEEFILRNDIAPRDYLYSVKDELNEAAYQKHIKGLKDHWTKQRVWFDHGCNSNAEFVRTLLASLTYVAPTIIAATTTFVVTWSLTCFLLKRPAVGFFMPNLSTSIASSLGLSLTTTTTSATSSG